MYETLKELKTTFFEKVKNHTMEIAYDNGVNRRLLFSKNGSRSYAFQIMTWHNHLCITGDMGCFVFCRIEDMFEFFRSKDYKFDPEYIEEKCIAGKTKEFNLENAIKSVNDLIDELCKENSYSIKNELESDFSDILNSNDEYEFINNFSNFSTKVIETDFLSLSESIDWKSYTYHFLWCIYAITYAVNEYDKFKAGGYIKAGGG